MTNYSTLTLPEALALLRERDAQLDILAEKLEGYQRVALNKSKTRLQPRVDIRRNAKGQITFVNDVRVI